MSTAKKSMLPMTKIVGRMFLLLLMVTALYLSRAIPDRDNPDTITLTTCITITPPLHCRVNAQVYLKSW